jgi:hypothetical protein
MVHLTVRTPKRLSLVRVAILGINIAMSTTSRLGLFGANKIQYRRGQCRAPAVGSLTPAPSAEPAADNCPAAMPRRQGRATAIETLIENARPGGAPTLSAASDVSV